MKFRLRPNKLKRGQIYSYAGEKVIIVHKIKKKQEGAWKVLCLCPDYSYYSWDIERSFKKSNGYIYVGDFKGKITKALKLSDIVIP